MHAIVTRILKLAHTYHHNGRKMTFYTTYLANQAQHHKRRLELLVSHLAQLCCLAYPFHRFQYMCVSLNLKPRTRQEKMKQYMHAQQNMYNIID